MKVLRSIAAVVVSYAVVFVIVWLSDPLLAHLYPGQYVPDKVPPAFLLRASTFIFALASIIGGGLCVRIAPSRPGLHLMILFFICEIVGAVFAMKNWATWPHWYSIIWLAIWPVGLWLGGLAKKRQTRQKLERLGAA
jgi:nitrate/nitrite transporter NarK